MAENTNTGTKPSVFAEDDSRADEGMLGEMPGWDDASLLELFKKAKHDSFDNRWIWERQWMRNVHYVNNRQWIVYDRAHNEWRDRRLAKNMPRPVTNKCKETVQAIKSILTSINIGVNVRPTGSEPSSISAAATADDMAPLMHEDHQMHDVLDEGDYWLLVTGNVFYHTFFDRDYRYGSITITAERCLACGAVYPSDEIARAGQKCPDCGAMEFEQATNPATGEPIQTTQPGGRGKTLALSPFEIAFPNTYPRFEEVPYLIRIRWRARDYYEARPTLLAQLKNVRWQKAPNERSLQIFKSLPQQSDLGVTPFVWGSSGGSANQEEGLPEYELWVRPNEKYPQGLVLRVVGDSDPIILHNEEEEGLPGPIPYTDNEGNAVFTFTHAGYDKVGGRIYASGPLDVIIQKQDQLNQLDSMFQMIIMRMSNPVWMIPKGSEIEKFTGDPGLVVKWNPLTVGGNAKPERISGEGPHGSFFQIREQYLADIEQLTGTFDIVKGAKPTGVEAFSALQLLVERSQSRFAGVFQSRGNAYKDWFKFAIEIERQFGPEKRVQAVLNPSKGYTFNTFMNTDLQGSFSVIVEDGSNTPKTSLGMRAAMEHANQLGMLNMQDPDQQYAGLRLMGLTKMVPSLDIHVQAALQKQQAFEEWLADPAAQQESFAAAEQEVIAYQESLATVQPDPMTGEAAIPPPPSPTKHTPLAYKPWYNAPIHRQELVKWANSDRIREALKGPTGKGLEGILTAALQELDGAIMQAAMMAAGPVAPSGRSGSGQGMENSNRESGGEQNVPSGNKEGAQGQGPA